MLTGLIVHEWAEPAGGAERVVDEFVRCYPDADVQVLWDDTNARFGPRTYESWLAKTPLRRHKAAALPFLLPTWRRIPDRADYEWALISSHLFAHHLKLLTSRVVPKYVYVHTPARYIWAPELDSRGGSSLARAASRVIKPIDKRRAGEATSISTNSRYTADRIAKCWDIEAKVIYPPVNLQKVRSVARDDPTLADEDLRLLDMLPSPFVLGASRFVRYKRLDLVIRAGEASGLPVVIAGSGPEEQALRELAAAASVPVTILMSPSDQLLFNLYWRAACFVFPAVEDFGIMPIEAMAAGAPVVSIGSGGAAESTRLTGGGVTVDDFNDAAAVSEAIRAALLMDRRKVSASVDQFSADRFRSQIVEWVTSSG
ncbi:MULTISPECIES: glycosyltransferase [Microbacterium]|uniref:glycosyltransferase n=1 Tax=Microbacterium TaxID=33882 RepID=UPI00201675EF|nr:glycosyltransferase [Microbacterium sp. 4NA327F11]